MQRPAHSPTCPRAEQGLSIGIHGEAWERFDVTVGVQPGACFPPSLEYFWLSFAALESWPADALAAAASSLRVADFDNVLFPEAHVTWEGLAQLRGLTALSIRGASFGEALPASLGALPLRALRLELVDLAFPELPDVDRPYAPLTSLSRLTELVLANQPHTAADLSVLNALPAELGTLPALATLDISASPKLVLQPASCTWLLRLSALHCCASHAIQLAPLLPNARHLATLALWIDAPLDPAALVSLSAALLAMPALTELLLHARAGVAGQEQAVQAAMLARPNVRVLPMHTCTVVGRFGPATVLEPLFPSAFNSCTFEELSAAALR